METDMTGSPRADLSLASSRPSGPLVAVVDIGTNSVRLLISGLESVPNGLATSSQVGQVKPSVSKIEKEGPEQSNSPGLFNGRDGSGQLHRLERHIRTTRLGQGVDQTGRLHPEAIERTCQVLADYAQRWQAWGIGADQVSIVATSAVRDASNAATFITQAVHSCGVTPTVISGDEEAELAFLGACADQPAGPKLVLDIGGGSTEFITGQAPAQIRDGMSVQVGCVRLCERLGPPPYTQDTIAQARMQIADLIGPALRRLHKPEGPNSALIGVAGTVTTLAALDLGLSVYDPARIHGYRLSIDRLAYWIDTLIPLDGYAIEAFGAVEPHRGDVLPLGAVILHTVMTAFGLDSVIASEHDSLDGKAYQQLTGMARGCD